MTRYMRAVLAISFTTSLGQAVQAAEACPTPTQDQAAYETFARRILIEKDPRGAYETLAAPDLAQKNPPFGADRESTIRQWLSLTARPGARFEIQEARVENGVGLLRFRGQIAPGNAAEVVQHDRLACGKIVEEWAEFRLLAAGEK